MKSTTVTPSTELRIVYQQSLRRLMAENPDIVVIDADLGKANATLPLRDEFPGRGFDVGVAEQNMAGVAAGLSSYGFIPFINSFTPFATRRICDQIAISISYAKQNVKIIGSDPGITAELNGGTHMSVEDVGVLRSIPGMVIVEPCDAVQMEQAIPAIARHEGPVYLRLFRKAAPPVYGQDYTFDLLRSDVVREGDDVTIFASGIMVTRALEAAQALEEDGVFAHVVNVHTIKPIDQEGVLTAARRTGRVVTCENHNIIGGLYSSVCEVLCRQAPLPVEAVGIPDQFGEVAKTPYLAQKFALGSDDIAAACHRVLAR